METALDIAQANFAMAIDQQDDFDTLGDALESYRQNAADTASKVSYRLWVDTGLHYERLVSDLKT